VTERATVSVPGTPARRISYTSPYRGLLRRALAGETDRTGGREGRRGERKLAAGFGFRSEAERPFRWAYVCACPAPHALESSSYVLRSASPPAPQLSICLSPGPEVGSAADPHAANAKLVPRTTQDAGLVHCDTIATYCSHTNTSRVPPATSAMRKTRRKGSLVGSTIRKTRRRELLKPDTPHSREGPRQGERRRWAALGRPDRP
jgi:hypothetical protein